MLRAVLALVFIVHGLGHLMGFLEAWTGINVGFTTRPWVFTSGVTIESPIGRIFGLLWLVALLGWVAAGVALLVQQAWWEPLALAAAVTSLVAILPWWNTVVPGARFGASLVDLVTIVMLTAPAWRSQLERMLH